MSQKPDCKFCQLESNADTNPRWVAAFDHSFAIVDSRQTFRGRTTLIVRNHYEDMLAVPEPEFAAINHELRVLATAIQTAFAAQRMNYANYGNVVPHQHWHVVPRYEGDLRWGGPPIEPDAVEKLADHEYEEIAEKIRSAL